MGIHPKGLELFGIPHCLPYQDFSYLHEGLHLVESAVISLDVVHTKKEEARQSNDL